MIQLDIPDWYLVPDNHIIPYYTHLIIYGISQVYRIINHIQMRVPCACGAVATPSTLWGSCSGAPRLWFHIGLLRQIVICLTQRIDVNMGNSQHVCWEYCNPANFMSLTWKGNIFWHFFSKIFKFPRFFLEKLITLPQISWGEAGDDCAPRSWRLRWCENANVGAQGGGRWFGWIFVGFPLLSVRETDPRKVETLERNQIQKVMDDSGFWVSCKKSRSTGFWERWKKLETSMWNCWGRVINGVGQI